MRENEGGKRPYVKPVAVFVDSRDAELRFSQEMLAQIRQVRRKAEEVRSIEPAPAACGLSIAAIHGGVPAGFEEGRRRIQCRGRRI